MDLKEIKQIIDLMKRSDLSEFAVEEEGFKLKIRRGTSGTPVVAATAPPAMPALPPETASAAPTLRPAPSSSQPAEERGIVYIKSPMVGTFYRAPSPDNPSFVEVNSKVVETSPVCIIEAMKIMNEIQAEVRGTIVEILVDSGQPVEFGQRLFKVKSS